MESSSEADSNSDLLVFSVILKYVSAKKLSSLSIKNQKKEIAGSESKLKLSF